MKAPHDEYYGPLRGAPLRLRVGARLLPARSARGEEAPEVEQDHPDVLRHAEERDEGARARAGRPGPRRRGAPRSTRRSRASTSTSSTSRVKSFIQKLKHPWPEDLDPRSRDSLAIFTVP